jgi:hypothetical protein
MNLRAWILVLLGCLTLQLSNVTGQDAAKLRLLYSRRFNAQGENRYTLGGAYSRVLSALSNQFVVKSDDQPLSSKNLKGVKVVLLANVSESASGTNAAPHHISDSDVRVLSKFVRDGGGLIFLSNQSDGHNLEVKDANKLLAQFGIQQTNLITDAKKLELPASAPIVGGLRWAFYTGNLLLLDPKNPARPEPIVTNDLAQKPIKGSRDQNGVLLARATPGKGRVVAMTDAGSIANFALTEEGVGGVAIKGQDNLEMFLRLARWVSGNP